MIELLRLKEDIAIAQCYNLLTWVTDHNFVVSGDKNDNNDKTTELLEYLTTEYPNIKFNQSVYHKNTIEYSI